MHSTPGINQRFPQELETEKEDECPYDHDRDEADEHGPSDEYSKGRKCEQDASYSTISSASHEKYSVRID